MGFPIRTPPGHRLFGISPRLFAPYNVLLRLLVSRHPPCALVEIAHNENTKLCFRCNIIFLVLLHVIPLQESYMFDSVIALCVLQYLNWSPTYPIWFWLLYTVELSKCYPDQLIDHSNQSLWPLSFTSCEGVGEWSVALLGMNFQKK